jgi:hypothetical protein
MKDFQAPREATGLLARISSSSKRNFHLFLFQRTLMFTFPDQNPDRDVLFWRKGNKRKLTCFSEDDVKNLFKNKRKNLFSLFD